MLAEIQKHWTVEIVPVYNLTTRLPYFKVGGYDISGENSLYCLNQKPHECLYYACTKIPTHRDIVVTGGVKNTRLYCDDHTEAPEVLQ